MDLKARSKEDKKIIIEVTQYDMTRHIDTTEVIFYYGKEIFKQSDDWGRGSVIWISEFENELNKCESPEEVLKEIKYIKKEGYRKKRESDLKKLGLSDDQIKAFMKCKVSRMWDHVEMKTNMIKTDAYPASLFKELANTKRCHEFKKIAKNWGLDALCDFYFPTAKLYAQQIYTVKK